MTSVFSRAALLAGVMTLASVAVAVAQTPPAAGADGAPRVERRVIVMGGPGGMHGPGGPGMHGPGMRHRMDPAAHAQHLRDVLQLRPDQEAALQAFLAASKPMTRTERHEPPAADAPPPKPLTTPERLDKASRRMAEHQAMFAKRIAAVRAFYGQLSPTQQKAFDALHIGGMGMRGHHPRRMRMMHPGGPQGPGGSHGPGGPGGPGGGGMIIQGEGGEDMVFIGGPEGDEEFEIELGEGPDAPEQ